MYDYFHGGETLAQSELGEYGLGAYRIDDGLSDEHAVVITRPDGSAVVSYRGTDHISDLLPDFQIAMGYHQNKILQRMGAAASHVAGDRFADARNRYTRAKEKYDDVTLTGHSLGGQLALHTARRHGAQSIVFNPGSSPIAEPFHAAVVKPWFAPKSRSNEMMRSDVALSAVPVTGVRLATVHVVPESVASWARSTSANSAATALTSL